MTDYLKVIRAGQVKWLLLSHPDFDHFSGVPGFLPRVGTGEVIGTERFQTALAQDRTVTLLASSLRATRQPLRAAHQGDEFQLGDWQLSVLWPPPHQPPKTNDNDTSLVVLLWRAGLRVLFPGDIADGAMTGLLRDHADGVVDLHADALVAPHHGSTTAKCAGDFYRTVAPRAVIVSSQTPRPKLDRLVRDVLPAGTQLLYTGQTGAITIHADGAIVPFWGGPDRASSAAQIPPRMPAPVRP